jgi:NADH-quinone oxidoreductase subunit C
MSRGAMPSESAIRYAAEAPAGVRAAVVEALAPFGPRWSVHHGDVGVLVPREAWLEVHRALRGAGYDFLTDHTAVDYPARDPRFTVVSVLTNLSDARDRLIVKTRVAEGGSVASLTPLWDSANWSERETYDMFGIAIEGHPDLTRIYMPEDYDGWPLRRDFPMQGHLRFRD